MEEKHLDNCLLDDTRSEEALKRRYCLLRACLEPALNAIPVEVIVNVVAVEEPLATSSLMLPTTTTTAATPSTASPPTRFTVTLSPKEESNLREWEALKQREEEEQERLLREQERQKRDEEQKQTEWEVVKTTSKSQAVPCDTDWQLLMRMQEEAEERRLRELEREQALQQSTFCNEDVICEHIDLPSILKKTSYYDSSTQNQDWLALIDQQAHEEEVWVSHHGSQMKHSVTFDLDRPKKSGVCHRTGSLPSKRVSFSDACVVKGDWEVLQRQQEDEDEKRLRQMERQRKDARKTLPRQHEQDQGDDDINQGITDVEERKSPQSSLSETSVTEPQSTLTEPECGKSTLVHTNLLPSTTDEWMRLQWLEEQAEEERIRQLERDRIRQREEELQQWERLKLEEEQKEEQRLRQLEREAGEMRKGSEQKSVIESDETTGSNMDEWQRLQRAQEEEEERQMRLRERELSLNSDRVQGQNVELQKRSSTSSVFSCSPDESSSDWERLKYIEEVQEEQRLRELERQLSSKSDAESKSKVPNTNDEWERLKRQQEEEEERQMRFAEAELFRKNSREEQAQMPKGSGQIHSQSSTSSVLSCGPDARSSDWERMRYMEEQQEEERLRALEREAAFKKNEIKIKEKSKREDSTSQEWETIKRQEEEEEEMRLRQMERQLVPKASEEEMNLRQVNKGTNSPFSCGPRNDSSDWERLKYLEEEQEEQRLRALEREAAQEAKQIKAEEAAKTVNFAGNDDWEKLKLQQEEDEEQRLRLMERELAESKAQQDQSTSQKQEKELQSQTSQSSVFSCGPDDSSSDWERLKYLEEEQEERRLRELERQVNLSKNKVTESPMLSTDEEWERLKRKQEEEEERQMRQMERQISQKKESQEKGKTHARHNAMSDWERIKMLEEEQEERRLRDLERQRLKSSVPASLSDNTSISSQTDDWEVLKRRQEEEEEQRLRLMERDLAKQKLNEEKMLASEVEWEHLKWQQEQEEEEQLRRLEIELAKQLDWEQIQERNRKNRLKEEEERRNASKRVLDEGSVCVPDEQSSEWERIQFEQEEAEEHRLRMLERQKSDNLENKEPQKSPESSKGAKRKSPSLLSSQVVSPDDWERYKLAEEEEHAQLILRVERDMQLEQEHLEQSRAKYQMRKEGGRGVIVSDELAAVAEDDD